MAGVKISALPALPSAALTDLIAEVQPAVLGVTYKATLQQVSNLFATSLVTPQDGGIVYTNATSMQVLAPTATANRVLMSGANTAPHWSTPTYPTAVGTAGQLIRSDGTNNLYTTLSFPDTVAQNVILFANIANNLGPLAPVNSSVLASSLTGVPTWLGPLTNGQIVIGSTGAIPVASTLTAGAGISIANGAGSITISSTGNLVWTEVVASPQVISVNNGYISNLGGGIAFSLPAVSAVGDTFSIVGKAGIWSITQGAGQTIHVGSTSTTPGVGGSLTANAATDSVNFVCVTANLEWQVVGGPQTAGFVLV